MPTAAPPRRARLPSARVTVLGPPGLTGTLGVVPRLSKNDAGMDARAALEAQLYDELRTLAARQMNGERRDHTLQPTALAHEAYLRLNAQREIDWGNRAQVLAIAAQLIRRILVDHARRKRTAKRGGGRERYPLVNLADPGADHAREGVDLLALDEALERLEDVNERHRRVVELRYFGGLTIEECATELGISPATVKTDWQFARAWLRRELES